MKFTRWAPLAGVLIAGLVLATPANAGGGTSALSSSSESSFSQPLSESSSDTSGTSPDESTGSASISLTEASSSDTSSSESETSSSDPVSEASTTSQFSDPWTESPGLETTTVSSPTCSESVTGSYELNGPSGLARVEIDGTLPLCNPYLLTLVAWAYVTPEAHWNQVADHQDSVSITEPGEYFLSVGEGWCGQVDLYNATPIALGTVMTGPSVGYQQNWPWALQPMTQAFWSADVLCSVPESTSSQTSPTESSSESTPSETSTSQTTITIDTSVTASPLPTTSSSSSESSPSAVTSTPSTSVPPVTSTSALVLVQQPGLILPNPGATGSTTGGSTVAATEPLAYTGFPTALLILGSAVLIAFGLVFVATSRKRNVRQH